MAALRPSLSLKGRALRALAGREHSRAELIRKLQGHEAEPGELTRVLDDLQAKGFIDERRVVASVVHQRASKLGASRIRSEIMAKGVVDAAAVEEAVDELRRTEAHRARAVWLKKFGGVVATEAAERARQMRFLASRGFAAEVVRRVVGARDDLE